MRVAIITESFPPDVNGVAHCVLRVAELLARGGHHPLVIAPDPLRASRDETTSYPFPVVRVPAVPLPGYPGFRLGLPGRRVRAALIRHRAELVHLASPVVLGAHGAAVARRLGLPTVAVYQTDLPSYARAYRFGQAGEAFAWRWLRGIHNGAVRTLAPSTVTATGLLGQGIENGWPRWAGWRPRARRGWSGGPATWYRPWWAWRCANGSASVNLNVLSKPSGNLRLYECLPSARLKVRNRFSQRNEKT